jgi:hypothetical protein
MDKPRKWKARSSKVGGWTKEMWIQQREWVSTNKKRVVEPIWADCSDLTGRLHVHSKRTAGLLTGIAQFASISWRFQCCGSLESRQNKAKNVLHKQSSTEKRCGPFRSSAHCAEWHSHLTGRDPGVRLWQQDQVQRSASGGSATVVWQSIVEADSCGMLRLFRNDVMVKIQGSHPKMIHDCLHSLICI